MHVYTIETVYITSLIRGYIKLLEITWLQGHHFFTL